MAIYNKNVTVPPEVQDYDDTVLNDDSVKSAKNTSKPKKSSKFSDYWSNLLKSDKNTHNNPWKSKEEVINTIGSKAAGVLDRFQGNKTRTSGGFEQALNHDYAGAGGLNYKYQSGDDFQENFDTITAGSEGRMLLQQYKKLINNYAQNGDTDSLNDMLHTLIQKLNRQFADKGAGFYMKGNTLYVKRSQVRPGVGPVDMKQIYKEYKDSPEFKAIEIITKGGQYGLTAAILPAAMTQAEHNRQKYDFDQKKKFKTTSDDIAMKLANYGSYIGNKGDIMSVASALANDIAGAIYATAQNPEDNRANALFENAVQYLKKYIAEDNNVFNSAFPNLLVDALVSKNIGKGVKSEEWLDIMRAVNAYKASVGAQEAENKQQLDMQAAGVK